MQAVGISHVGLDQGMDRLQRDSRVPDQIRQCGQAQLDAFPGKPFSLPVQRLVLTIFLKGDHGDQAGPGPSTRDRMKRGWWLADLFASPTSELLAHGLDHLPLPRDHLQSLGDILAHLHDTVRATAGAGGRCLYDNPLPRQVIGERLAHRRAAREGAHRRGLFGRPFGGQGVLGGRRFQLFKLQFQLIDQAGAPFRRDAVFVTA